MSYITREEASSELLRLVNAQSVVFTSLQAEARTLVDRLASTADAAMRRERAEIEGQLGHLREHTQKAVRTVETELGVHETTIQRRSTKWCCSSRTCALSPMGFSSKITETQPGIKAMHAKYDEDRSENHQA